MESKHLIYSSGLLSPKNLNTTTGGHHEVAPLKKIEQIKANTKQIQANNTHYKHTIEKLDNEYLKVSKGVNNLKKMAVQASADKIELLRDLSTYEINFSN